jgi:uncharacterized membrane protein YecN with MAPEG domain
MKTTTISADHPQKLMEVATKTVENQCEYIPGGIKILGEVDLTVLLSAILAANIKILHINCGETSFEDYYLSVIGGAKE